MQELIRRLRNTRKEINYTRKQEILSEYMHMLKNSGYSVRFRKEIMLSGMHGYNKILEADRNRFTDQRTGRDLPGGWIVGKKPKMAWN